MKKLSIIGVFFLVLFSFAAIPNSNCLAAEIKGVTGDSYLIFIDQYPYLEIFTFDEEGNFSMEVLEDTLPGEGTYTDHGPIFTANWTSTEESTTYSLTGLSMVSMVIMGSGRKTVDYGSKTKNIFFVGIWKIIFPD